MPKIKLKCPRCLTGDYLIPNSYGQKVGTALGGTVGAGLGYLGLAEGVALGAMLGSFIPVAGTFTGLAIGGLSGLVAGFITGSLTGNFIGGEVDNRVIRQYKCSRCGLIIHC